MLSPKELRKPANAGWVAKVEVVPEGATGVARPEESARDHQFRTVNIAWYGNDRIKITLVGGAPALIRQAYLSGTGRDVILDLVTTPPQ